MKTKTTGTAPERPWLARNKRPTGNTSAGRLAHVMEFRRPMDGVVRKLCRECRMEAEVIPFALAAAREALREMLNRPDPRARLMERRKKLRSDVEQAFSHVIMTATILRKKMEARP